MSFQDLFGDRKPLIGVLHLLPLPGAPLYEGAIQKAYDQALAELEIFKRHVIDSVIVENFRDMPYFPGRVPVETVAAMAAVSREIVRAAAMPVGINVLRSDGGAASAAAGAGPRKSRRPAAMPVGITVLRSDGEAAIAVAAAAGAHYVRVNVHMGAV